MVCLKNSVDVYNERLRIENKKAFLISQVRDINTDLACLQYLCPHKFVLALDDHKPHKAGRIVKCVCPACGMRDNIFPNNELNKNIFHDSMIVDLTSLSSSVIEKQFSSILEHIFSNYDYYYGDEVTESDITDSIIDFIKTGKVKSLVKKN